MSDRGGAAAPVAYGGPKAPLQLDARCLFCMQGWDGHGPTPAPASGPAQWRAYLDLGAFADYLLATEAAKNPDGYRGSVRMYRTRTPSPLQPPKPVAGRTAPLSRLPHSFPCCVPQVYMYKDVSAPLVMGPLWDYNEAFGICCGYPVTGFDKDGISTGAPTRPPHLRMHPGRDGWDGVSIQRQGARVHGATCPPALQCSRAPTIARTH